MPLFTGLSAFPITPQDPEGRVDVAAVRRLVRRLVAAKVDSIGLLGSTGSYAYLSRKERRLTVEAAVDAAAGGPPVMVGIGALRTDAAIDFGQDAKAAGAHAVLLAPISYVPLTDDEVFAHFEAVSGAVGLPLCIYDNPAATHFSFTPELVARLAHLPNIQAIKSPPPLEASVTGQIEALKPLVPAAFSLGYSTDWRAPRRCWRAARPGTACLAAYFLRCAWRSAVRWRRGMSRKRWTLTPASNRSGPCSRRIAATA